jgi:hypothetical protein
MGSPEGKVALVTICRRSNEIARGKSGARDRRGAWDRPRDGETRGITASSVAPGWTEAEATATAR